MTTGYVTRRQSRDAVHLSPDCPALAHVDDLREIQIDRAARPICQVCNGTAEQAVPDFSHYRALEQAAREEAD